VSIRVCIPTAGTGSRLGEQTRHLNKSLASVAHRPVLSHLIEQFLDDTEFVIALGHKGELVREFLSLAYPDRTFFFAEVTPFEGSGSGLGLSLLACNQYLRQPFIFISCDTLVREAIPAPTENWMAYSEVENLSPYRTLKIESGQVADICEKTAGITAAHKAYIGLASIHDFSAFWTAMEQGGAEAINTGEAHGLRALLPNVTAHRFTWYDTGNKESLAHVREIYKENHAPVILEKANEAIWFIGSNVIKFSNDTIFIAHHVQRSGALVGFIPEVNASTPHMYRYEKKRPKGKSSPKSSHLPWSKISSPTANASGKSLSWMATRNKNSRTHACVSTAIKHANALHFFSKIPDAKTARKASTACPCPPSPPCSKNSTGTGWRRACRVVSTVISILKIFCGRSAHGNLPSSTGGRILAAISPSAISITTSPNCCTASSSTTI